jgi:hypothetical protein
VNAAKEATSMKATDEATTMAGSDSFDDGGPDTTSTDRGGAPDMTSGLEVVGKRPATTIGSGCSSPPNKRFYGSWWYATRLLQFSPFYSLLRLSDPCLYVDGCRTHA